MERVKRKLSYAQWLALGFIIVILLGTFLLCLPFASKSREWTPFLNALFTATSATCVTGLVVVDTFAYFSLFGQIVILILIQIGGLGFMMVISMISIFLGKQLGLYERKMIMQSSGSLRLNGVTSLLKVIFRGTFILEGIGAVILAIRFVPHMGVVEGIYNAIFHSISAFCNAGFDLMGKYGLYSSLTTFATDKVVLLTLSFLIVSGGIGFLVWRDICKHKFHLRKYELHSKIVLVTTAILIFGGAGLYFLFEHNNPETIKNMSLMDQIINCLFQSITTRTAGFNALDQGSLKESSIMLTIANMFIGGSPASTAGGVKTTTIAIIVLNAIASARKNRFVETKRRRINDVIVKQASAIMTIYLLLVIVGAFIMMPSAGNVGFSLTDGIYTLVSAIGTVGLSIQDTASLAVVGKIVLIVLMYVGRIGGLTLALSLSERRGESPLSKPSADVVIG